MNFSKKEMKIMHAVDESFATVYNTIDMNMAACDDGMTLGQMISKLMDDRKISIREMVSLSGLSESTIKRYRKGSTKVTLEGIISICISLHLNIRQSLLLICKSGIYLNNSPECSAYINIICLNSSLNLSLVQCNDLLVKGGFEPLNKNGKKQKK